MNRKKELEENDKKFSKKTRKLDAIWSCQKSIAWWHKESEKANEEARQVEFELDNGTLTEEEAYKKGKALEKRIDYLEAKGQFEQKQWENLVSGKK